MNCVKEFNKFVSNRSCSKQKFTEAEIKQVSADFNERIALGVESGTSFVTNENLYEAGEALANLAVSIWLHRISRISLPPTKLDLFHTMLSYFGVNIDAACQLWSTKNKNYT
jgi:hypothetical protein